MNDVLSKKDFSRYITEKERYTFIARLLEAAKYYKLAVHIDACRDPKDNKFLELAVGTNAAAIITGDRDLLVLHPYGGITILAPHAFLKHGWKK